MKDSQEDPRPNSPLYKSQMDSQSRSVSELPHYPSLQFSQSPFARKTVSPDLPESATKVPNSSSPDRRGLISVTADFQRRNAALFEAAERNRLSIPPKRELPFPKPGEMLPRFASVSTFSDGPKPPPITRPQSAIFATEGQAIKQTKEQTQEPGAPPVVKVTKKRVAQRKSTAVKPAEVAESPPENQSKANGISSVALPQDEPSPLATKSFAAVPRPKSTTGLQSKATAPKKRAAPARPSSVLKRLKTVDQFTQTETISSRDPATALDLVRNPGTSGPVVAHPASVPTSASVPPSESYLDAIDTFVSKHRSRPRPKEIWEQPGWAEADQDERQRILNNFICENLENKDFIQLCEDTMVSWRRIGLGL